MIKTSTLTRPLFALAAALVATPLAAQEPTVVTGNHQPVFQERIGIADLDLRQSKARLTLMQRVMQASTNVCIQAEGQMNMNRVLGGPENTCPNRTYRVARPQITAVIRRAMAGQPQLTTAFVITAPTMAR